MTTRRCEMKPEVPEYVWFGCQGVVRTVFLGKNGSGRAKPARLRGRGFKRDKVKVFERTEKDVPCDPRAKPEPAAEPSLRPKAGAAPGVDAWACTRTARGRCTCVRMRTGTSASSFGRWANAGGSNVLIAGSSKRRSGSNPDGRAPAVARVSFPRKNAVGRSIGRGTMRANGCKGENGPEGGARGWAPRAPMAHRQKAAPVSPLK